jgi:hypothetical protein
MTITTDSTTVNLTGQEAINEAEIGHNTAILHWRVINRLSRSGGDATGIDGLDTTCGIASHGITRVFTGQTSSLVSYLTGRSAITNYR